MLENASRVIGYQFKDETVLREALTHASSADSRLQSNERLEFLGDAILGYVVSDYLFEIFPEYLEGELTKIKSAVVSRRACAIISEKLDLVSLLNMGKGMTSRSDLPSSVAAAVFEAVIAAIFQDGGMRPTKRFILKHLKPLISSAAESTHQDNFKSALQHYAQRHLPCNPSYVLLDEKGPDHSKAFEICVEIDGHRYGGAWANSKKQAEQAAALNALCELKLVTVSENGDIVLHENTAEKATRRRRAKEQEETLDQE
jgi:ribonuclease III